jgi:SYP6 family syntaxin
VAVWPCVLGKSEKKRKRKPRRAADRPLAEFRWHTDEIKKATKNITWDLQDLEEAVEVASKDPSRFGLTVPEIADRRKFITTLKKQVESIASELTSEATLSKVHSDAQTALFAVSANGTAAAASGGGAAAGGANSSHDFAGTDQTQILAIRERQDGQLDDLHQHMQKVHEMSTTIGTEIGEHIELLQEVDQQVEYTSGRMGSALRKIDKLLSAAGDRGALFIVVFLVIVLIGLIVLVFNV